MRKTSYSAHPCRVFASHSCNLDSQWFESLRLSLSPQGGNASPVHRTRVLLNLLRPTSGHLGILMHLSQQAKKGAFTVQGFHPDYQEVVLHTEGLKEGLEVQGVSRVPLSTSYPIIESKRRSITNRLETDPSKYSFK